MFPVRKHLSALYIQPHSTSHSRITYNLSHLFYHSSWKYPVHWFYLVCYDHFCLRISGFKLGEGVFACLMEVKVKWLFDLGESGVNWAKGVRLATLVYMKPYIKQIIWPKWEEVIISGSLWRKKPHVKSGKQVSSKKNNVFSPSQMHLC